MSFRPNNRKEVFGGLPGGGNVRFKLSQSAKAGAGTDLGNKHSDLFSIFFFAYRCLTIL